MSYLIWMISWIICQRLMMLFGLVAYNSMKGTILLTLFAFVFCFFAHNTWLLPFYIIWIIVWAVNCFRTGGIVAGIAVIIFHLILYIIFMKKDVREDA